MVQGAVVLGILRPANEQAAVAVEPGVRALDDPAPREPSRVFALGLDLLAAGSEVQGEAEACGDLAHLGEVIALVEAEALGALGGGLRAVDWDRGDRLG
jgi:hypothetical protein